MKEEVAQEFMDSQDSDAGMQWVSGTLSDHQYCKVVTPAPLKFPRNIRSAGQPRGSNQTMVGLTKPPKSSKRRLFPWNMAICLDHVFCQTLPSATLQVGQQSVSVVQTNAELQKIFVRRMVGQRCRE